VTRTDANNGPVEAFASGAQLTLSGDGATANICGDEDETCTAASFTVASTGDLIVASSHDTDILGAEINNFSITGVTTGFSMDFSGGPFTSNDNSDAALTEFNVGNTLDATTVFPGITERTGTTLTTTLQTVTVYFTDRYNGVLPRGTTVTVESDNSSGCTIASVGGVNVNSNEPGADSGNSHSGEVTVGSTTTTATSVVLTTGFGSGPVTATVVTPSGTTRSSSISCQL